MTANNNTTNVSHLRVILPLLILLAVILWFGLTYYAALQWRRSEAATARARVLHMAHLALGEQARSIREARALLSGLAQLPIVRRGDPLPCSAHLSPLLRDNRDHYANLGVVRPDGEVICSALPIPEGSALHVITQDGTVLTREPDRERWVGQSRLGVPVFRTVLEQGRAGMAEGIGLDGVQQLVGYSPLITSSRGGNAYVVVAIPVTGAFAAFERTMVREFAKLGLLIALAMAVTWVVSDLILRRRVKTLVSATERLRLGDLSARTGLSYGRGRIGRLASAFDEMAAALEARRAEAERTEAALRALNEALEQEARRIGQALHDEAGQLLAVIYMGLDRCALDLPPAVQARLREVRGHLDLVEGQLRHLSHELRPTILEDLGVVPALRFLAEGVSKRTGLAIAVEGDTDGRLPVMVETALYRVVQEALANAAKHAKAGSVRIQLHREDRQIRCAVLDDGIGFDLPDALAIKGDRGLGLIGMQERLKGVEGALQITSAPGRGTAIRITIPLGA